MTAAGEAAGTRRWRVGIAGLGLIGGSAARRLAGAGHEVTGWDPDGPTRSQASDAGVAIADSVAGLCRAEPDVLILAVPLRALTETVAEVSRHLTGSTVVTDVASVKTPVLDLVRAAGLSGRFIGGHPMAGTELSGFAASTAELLDDATWALTLDEDSGRDAFWTVAELVCGPLRGAVTPVRAAAHDEAVALVSHVPHVLGTELLALVARSELRGLALGLAAGSFRGATRVAGTDPRRTEAMVAGNATRVARVLRELSADLATLSAELERGAAVSGFFDAAASLRGPAPQRRPLGVTVGSGADWARELTGLGERGALFTAADRASGRLDGLL